MYVPLLLRLSNVVEENPGSTVIKIINPSQTGDERFGHNAGKQCVAMSLLNFNI